MSEMVVNEAKADALQWQSDARNRNTERHRGPRNRGSTGDMRTGEHAEPQTITSRLVWGSRGRRFQVLSAAPRRPFTEGAPGTVSARSRVRGRLLSGASKRATAGPVSARPRVGGSEASGCNQRPGRWSDERGSVGPPRPWPPRPLLSATPRGSACGW